MTRIAWRVARRGYDAGAWLPARAGELEDGSSRERSDSGVLR